MYYEIIMSYVSDFVLVIKICLKNILNFKKINSLEFTLVTASDEKHYPYLVNFINNFQQIQKNRFKKLIIFDLGLSTQQHQKLLENKILEIRKFPFEKYPKYFGLRLKEHKYKIGGFAWKPEIVNILKNEGINCLIWLDSATMFQSNLILFKIFIYEYGFASFNSTGNIKQWTHPSVLEDLSLNDNQFILNSTNLMAGVVGFNFNNQFAKKLHQEWNKLSSNENMIFPANSSSSNHRHDQSLLSIAYWNLTKNRLPSNTFLFNIKIQNWPNKILFFFDEKNNIRQKLMNKHYFNSTTTDKRCKLIVLLNVESLKKIPWKLILTKKVLLFIFNESEKAYLRTYLLKKNFIDIRFIKNDLPLLGDDNDAAELDFQEVDKIIEEEYKITTHEK